MQDSHDQSPPVSSKNFSFLLGAALRERSFRLPLLFALGIGIVFGFGLGCLTLSVDRAELAEVEKERDRATDRWRAAHQKSSELHDQLRARSAATPIRAGNRDVTVAQLTAILAYGKGAEWRGLSEDERAVLADVLADRIGETRNAGYYIRFLNDFYRTEEPTALQMQITTVAAMGAMAARAPK